MIWISFLALLAGGFTILSMILNAQLGKRIGILQSTLMNYFVASMGLFFPLLFTGQMKNLFLLPFNEIPWWAFLGGAIGVSVVILSNIVTPKIPVIYTTLLTFLGQMIVGITMDIFLTHTFSLGKVVGVSLIGAGLLYNIHIDKKEAEISLMK
ncbi:DMT family transporter [Irregularibacter muris]|uniref:DMT family transporter n=1 Tax=Irregularibacter muris TaxID=1796619 RepID=A0AAE3HFF7_9FIRM|nr:DMT family transporter [Irregularibacter muris]MCR1899601.1 DMT family transporter [Irregularibacter muris]